MQGFIVTTASGALRICQLPARVRLDTHWPLQKVPLRATPHCLAFYAEARLYALLTSRQASAQALRNSGCCQTCGAWLFSVHSDRHRGVSHVCSSQ